jgi:ribonuclease T2
MPRQFLILVLAVLASSAHADQLSGTFTATSACPALQSISRETNPGNITTSPGQNYELLEGNRTPPTHLRITVPGASPVQRWVSVDCGDSPALIASAPEHRPAAAYRGTQYVLSVNWQPAFCEINSRVRECRDQRPNAFDATCTASGHSRAAMNIAMLPIATASPARTIAGATCRRLISP